MKTTPKIQKYMTPMPHTIGLDQPIQKALDLMREHRIRHLPVQEGGRLVGILSDRDIKLAASFAGQETLTCEDVMTPDPYTVLPEADLQAVASEMAEHKYGCAIIHQPNGKVTGIFTEVDALRVLTDVLRENYKPGHA
jgi:acetoin utilization protein AcuB